MAADRRTDDGGRELRLEGAGLVVIGGLLLAAIVGAFFLGRWVERRATPARMMAADRPGPLSQVVSTDDLEDADAGADFFDGPAGTADALEPKREARPTREPEPEPPPRAAADPEPGLADGFFVQVFAGRDRRAAENLVGKLRTQGYQVRLFSEKEGRGALFKVRVGGYATEERARTIAANLQQDGYSGAWVTHVE